MDDTAQSPAQSGQQTMPSQPVSQPVPQSVSSTQDVSSVAPQDMGQNAAIVSQEPVVQAPQAQQSPSQPQVSVLTGGKEHEATGIAEVQPTQPEIVVPQEVQEAGVEASPSEEPQLTQEHKEAGIEAVKEAAPIPSGPTIVQLPEDYKAPKGFFALFRQRVKNAATWLYLLLFKAEQQAAKKAAQEKKNV